ncbi:hypothetical protein PPACK8108_LOCUS20216 [Phakopsora pachyrhizi]|uniref:Uncharacterized protein n=1 Tax=Phakopsora pachyrhizi TaxID=170000 RepID=A0AAV0BFD4_PHAPC|nr:hypothetical protein PPACK8108_LOCUS20216 [Phakopsora pachyrhizi]
MAGRTLLESEDQAADDLLAIDLRVRLLECVVVGSLPSSANFAQRIQQLSGNQSGSNLPSTQASVGHRAERVLSELRNILDNKPNEAIRRFVESYDLNEPLLHIPNPLLNQRECHASTSLSLQEKLELVLEADSEITQLERDLREIELLDQRGFTGSGRLTGELSLHKAFVRLFSSIFKIPKFFFLFLLQTLVEGNFSTEDISQDVLIPLEECKRVIFDLESRATDAMSHYDSYVSKFSQLNEMSIRNLDYIDRLNMERLTKRKIFYTLLLTWVNDVDGWKTENANIIG